MKSFKSIASYTVAGKKIFAVANDINRDPKNFDDLYPAVEIDGVKYKVGGVESFAMNHCPAGAPIGIMVDEQTGDRPTRGDYALTTKYNDGDPKDPWDVGFYTEANISHMRLSKSPE